ncbi:MAG TPA: NADH-quinone oxidoreductase subunit M, partial [Opitutales bacterium]|nr:NADH-quinone oxidoreductase subunit M [Opitutales bacterium]
MLSGVVGLAAGLYAIQSDADSKGTYLGLLLLMLTGLMGTFASVDVFFYYLFHEFALIPTFIMIGYWGGRGRRSIALEVTIYLTVGAMITLIGLIALYVQSGADYFTMIELREVLRQSPLGASTQQSIVWMLIIGFGILVALWPFHSWAPRAYAAAPSSAAMLHAGVLKKFGLYGLIQIAAPMLPEGMEWGSTWLIPLALANVLVIGFVTMAQRDLKLMLGYSSVMHMGYIFLAICTLSILGIGAAIMLMVAHGFVVALLLMLATSIHKRTGTLDLKAMGGLGTQAPVLAALFIAAMLANIGLPGFANFWGELLVFVSLSAFYPIPVTLAVIGIVI